MSQVTTITFYRYKGFLNKVWAFGMMQFAHKYLADTPGLTFYKLLGTGKGNGFNPYPDWGTYALLQVWGQEVAADAFFSTSPLINKYRVRSAEQWRIYMRAIKAEGQWSGQHPFEVAVKDKNNPYLAIITRATIRKRRLLKFWKYVPTSERPLKHNDGLQYTKGVGEVPFFQMATFSLWSSEESLKKFAYHSQEHAKAIALTRQLNWYSEELFARFQPYRSEGTWNGEDQGNALSSLQ